MGWVGREILEKGIYIHFIPLWLRLTRVVVWQKQTQHCKAIFLQLFFLIEVVY